MTLAVVTRTSARQRKTIASIKRRVDMMSATLAELSTAAPYPVVVDALTERQGMIHLLTCSRHQDRYAIGVRMDGRRFMVCPSCVQEISAGTMYG